MHWIVGVVDSTDGQEFPVILCLDLCRDGEKTGDPSVDVGTVAVKDVASIAELERPHNLSGSFWALVDAIFN